MNKNILLLALPILFFVASCTKQPVACLTASKKVVDVDEEITFTSCADNASTIEWDFGDSQKGEGETVKHAYTTPGVYIVNLRVLSKDKKKTDRFSVAITVNGKNRYLTKIVLKAFADKKPDGSVWDAPSSIPGVTVNPEADIFIRISAPGTGWTFNTSTVDDVKAAMLPLQWNVAQQNIFLSNYDWTVEARDSDNFGASSELMKSFSIANPSTAGSDGKIVLKDGAYELELFFENR